MDLEPFIKPWAGVAVRHLPDRDGVNPLDFSFCGIREGRWNQSGVPTLYLSQNESVALSEYARWFDLERAKLPSGNRAVYTVEIDLVRVCDLRDSAALKEVGFKAVTDIFDQTRTRSLAAYLRGVQDIQAILVPPAAMVDRPASWNLIVFLENTEGSSFIRSCKRTGGFAYVPTP